MEGIDDNLPGVLLALLAAIAFVLAFAYPWRATRKLTTIVLTLVFGFVLIVIMNSITDSITQTPATSDTLKYLRQRPATDTLGLIIAMICAAAFSVGAIGSVAM